MLVNAPSKRFRLPQRPILIRLVIIVVVIAAGFVYLWHEHRPKPIQLTAQQQKVANTIQNQKVYADQEEQQGRPNGTKSITYSNLAASYAYTGQCDQAKSALEQAKSDVTSDTEQNYQNSVQEVNYYCH